MPSAAALLFSAASFFIFSNSPRRIALFYAWDWGPSADKNWRAPDEQLPGSGVLDFPAIFRALAETGHKQPLCLFAHGIEDWPADQAQEGLQRALEFCREIERRHTANAAG